MKNLRVTMFSAFMLVILTTTSSLGQNSLTSNPFENMFEKSLKAQEIIRDNELEPNEIGQFEDFFCNPLLLDGKPLDYESFSINSKGELALVNGDSESAESVLVPFHILLRRNGTTLQGAKMDFLNVEHNRIELSKVLTFAKPGDQLIINPVNKEHWRAKRILNLFDGC